MSRLLLSGIVTLLFIPSLALAYGGSDQWSVGAEYTNLDYVGMGSVTTGHQTAPTYSAPQYSAGASTKGQAALLTVTYRSVSGFFLTLFGGMTFKSEIDSGATVVGNSAAEAWTFASAPTYGATFGFDIFPDSRIHLIPSIRWQQTHYTGTAGSVYNSSTNTTYTYGSGNTASGYTTVGGYTQIAGQDGGSIATDFNQTMINARMGLSFDIVSDGTDTFTIGGGVEDAFVYLSGNVSHSYNSGFAEAESYNFGSNTQLGYFGMLNLALGAINIGGEAHFTAEKYYMGRVAFNF